jgi:hypothetical protein
MKAVIAGVGLLAALVFALTPPAFAQATRSDGIDWTRVMRALGNALNAWRLSPFPRRTPTPIRTRTATVAPVQPTATRTVPTPTSTRVLTATRTLPPPTRTRTATRTGTNTRTPSITRTPSLTPSPRPTSTPVPTTSNSGLIAFGEAEGIPPAQKLASAFVVFHIWSPSRPSTRVSS